MCEKKNNTCVGLPEIECPAHLASVYIRQAGWPGYCSHLTVSPIASVYIRQSGWLGYCSHLISAIKQLLFLANIKVILALNISYSKIFLISYESQVCWPGYCSHLSVSHIISYIAKCLVLSLKAIISCCYQSYFIL